MATVTAAAAPSDLLRGSDLTPEQQDHLLHLSEKMKGKPRGWRKWMRGESVACFFEKPSTRTRVSFEAAIHRLGMHPIVLRPEELQLGRGEPIADTGRVLAGYCAAIVIRTYAQATLERVAEAADVPVVNALSDDHHPCQALADLLTLREHFGATHGLKLAYVGDGGNVTHSLIEAGALAGMQVAVASPPGYEPDPGVVAGARTIADVQGGNVTVTNDPREAVEGADAVYTDVWVSMGQDAEREQRLQALRPYQVNAELMAAAKSHAVFMHCLPAHRGEEVAAEVMDGPQSVVWEQAANRLPTGQAALYALIGGEWGSQG